MFNPTSQTILCHIIENNSVAAWECHKGEVVLIRVIVFFLVFLNLFCVSQAPSWGLGKPGNMIQVPIEESLVKMRTVQFEDVKKSFLSRFGGDPSRWPEPFKKIHEIGVKWSLRAMKSRYYKNVLNDEIKEKMLLQINNPAEYWARNIYNGWDYGEWFDASHLTVEGLPVFLLERYMEDIFPLAWIDIKGSLRTKEYMLKLKDSQFRPSNTYDKKVALQRREDVFTYNEKIIETAKRYEREMDLPFLMVLSRFVDTNWPGDASVEKKLETHKREVEKIASKALQERKAIFLKAFLDRLPVMSYSWMNEPYTEVQLHIDPRREDKTFEFVGSIVKIYGAPDKVMSEDEKVPFEERKAFGVKWEYSVHGFQIEEGAEVFEASGKDGIFLRTDNGEEVCFVAIPGRSSFVGTCKVTITFPEVTIPKEIRKEICDQFFEAFVSASEVFFKGSTKQVGDGSVSKEGKEKRELLISCSLREGESGALNLNSETFVIINILVKEKDKPVPNARVAVRKPKIGEVWSSNAIAANEEILYITTDPLGRSSIIFTPPKAEELEVNDPGVNEVSILLEEEETGAVKETKIKLELPSVLRARVESQFLPKGRAFYNRIYFSVDGGSKGPKEGICKVALRATSGNGLFSLSSEGPWVKDRISLEVQYGKEYVVLYKCNYDEELKSPFEENVIVEVPEMNLYDLQTFKVGAEPSIGRVEIAGSENPIPGAYVPLKLILEDNADGQGYLDSLLKSYRLKPVLEIEPVEFEPIPSENPKNERILNGLLDRASGVVVENSEWSFDPTDFTLVRQGDSQWVLVKRDMYSKDMQEKMDANVFPGFTPLSWGNYKFRITLHFEDEDNKYDELMSTYEERVSVHPQLEDQEDKLSLLPLLVFFRAVSPREYMLEPSYDIELAFREGKIEEGAFLLGKAFSELFSVPEELSPSAEAKLKRLKTLAAAAEGKPFEEISDLEIIRSLRSFKESFLATVGGLYAEELLKDAGGAGQVPSSLEQLSNAQIKILKIIQAFLDGFGDYGFVAVFCDSVEELTLYDKETGKRLKPIKGEIFTIKSENEDRLWVGRGVLLVPLRLGENLVMDVRSPKDSVLAMKILPNGINMRRFCVGKSRERVNIYGDVVLP
jgi:hypothetical protein